MTICACGCGGELDFTKGRRNKKYLKGHAARVDNRGGKARKGVEPWNKGIPRTDEEKQNISKAIIEGKKNSSYVFTEEHKQNVSKGLKGHKKTKEWIDKVIKSRESNPTYELMKKRISEIMKEKHRNGEAKNPFYIDGRYKNEPNSNYNLYGGQFTDELKYTVRKRDSWICQLCGKLRSTHVHHIDCNKLNNNEKNLITLCGSCHAKHHHVSNTKFKEQQQLFEEMINEKYKNCTDL
jgi:hypothetical protein